MRGLWPACRPRDCPALDDFGTGFSSLSYLKRFPIQSIKVDRFFVQELLDHDVRETIIPAIFSIAETFGMQLIAEGVEAPVQLTPLVDLGCRLVQGYHFSRPLPADEARKLLEGAPPWQGRTLPGAEGGAATKRPSQ